MTEPAPNAAPKAWCALSPIKGSNSGATILAPHAGEMIHSWTLAIQNRLGMAAMANTIAPYPSWS